MGYIYIIKCTCTSKVYIGQTTKALEQRWYEHRREARRLAKRRARGEKTGGIDQSHLYNAMVCYGVDKFSIEILEQAPDETLDALETKYIGQYNSAEDGYNLTSGGGGFRHSEDTIALMKEVKRANLDEHRHPKLKGMPVHTSYMAKDSGYEAIRIVKHPLCTDRVFSSAKYGSFEQAKKAACEFLEQLERTAAETEPAAHSERREGTDGLSAENATGSPVTADAAASEPRCEAEAASKPTRPRARKTQRKVQEFDGQPQCELENAVADLRCELRIKPNTGLPAGIMRKPNGYKVHKRINKTLYQKCFENSKQPDEVKKQAAFEYLQELLRTHRKDHVQRLDGSGPEALNESGLKV
jgi:group I intron endonuclease